MALFFLGSVTLVEFVGCLQTLLLAYLLTKLGSMLALDVLHLRYVSCL